MYYYYVYIHTYIALRGGKATLQWILVGEIKIGLSSLIKLCNYSHIAAAPIG